MIIIIKILTHFSIGKIGNSLFQLHSPNHSGPCFTTGPSPSTVQSSLALATAQGEPHVWLPGTPTQQQPSPYTHSIYWTTLSSSHTHTHTHTHTQHTKRTTHTSDGFKTFHFWIAWTFFIGRPAKDTYNVVLLWLALRLMPVHVCEWVRVSVCVCVGEVCLHSACGKRVGVLRPISSLYRGGPSPRYEP